MKNKKGSSFKALSMVLAFWILLLIISGYLGKVIVKNYDNEKITPTQNNLSILWKVMTFQIVDVPAFISLMIDFIFLITIAITIYVIRGVS